MLKAFLTTAVRAGLLLAAGLSSQALPAAASVLDSYQARIHGTVIVWGADAADPAAGVPVVSDFILDTGPGNTAAVSTDHDLIAGDVHTVVTGSLTPVSNSWHDGQGAPMRLNALAGQPNFFTDTNGDGVMDANDSFAPFRIRAASDTNVRRMEIETSFYVASNTRFSIDAQATPTGSTTPAQLQRIRLTLSTTQSGDDGIAFGAAAQYPHTAGPSGGSQANNRSLSTMVVPRRVFLGNQRTAAARGSLADQSVRFDLLYRYNHGNTDLSDGTFDIGAVVVYTVYIP